jgi:hypothetical protein
VLIRSATLTVHRLREELSGWTWGDILFSYDTPLVNPPIQVECVGYGELVDRGSSGNSWIFHKEDIDNLLPKSNRKPYYKIKWDNS